MLLATALLIIGLLLVVYSADRLVFAASILCRLIGMPPIIIGMTVVSVGTSLPEIIVSVSASLHGQVDLAIGTAIGSNIVNILLILGLAALLHPFRVHSDVLRRELPLMLVVSLLAGYVLYDGVLSVGDGIFLLALAVIWLLYSVKIARLAEKQGNDSLTREHLAELPREGTLPVALLWLGVALIIGIARGIVVIMDKGMITHTILHSAEGMVTGLSTVAFINVMYWLEVVLSFLVPSSSGLAVLTMPIMAPLADFANVNRDRVVTAYQSASGIVNLITPTSAVVMGGLAIARVPYVRYLKWVAPLLGILTVVIMVALSLGALL